MISRIISSYPPPPPPVEAYAIVHTVCGWGGGGVTLESGWCSLLYPLVDKYLEG
jgi:hypothetical protein